MICTRYTVLDKVGLHKVVFKKYTDFGEVSWDLRGTFGLTRCCVLDKVYLS